jgi:hypothetical protein
LIHNSIFLKNLGKVIVRFPNADLTKIFSEGQLESKKWLINKLIELDLELGTVFLCAGWYGILASFLAEANIKINKIRSFDIDPTCAKIADTFNKNWEINNWKFKASTLDIVSMEYPTKYIVYTSQQIPITLIDTPNTIINTSCEHIKDFDIWYNKILNGTLLILQSNNYTEIIEHTNCKNSLDEFKKSTPMRSVLYEGEIELMKYKRYMRIGYK